LQFRRTAELVGRLRRAQQLSQRQFGALAGTSGPTVAAYEAAAKEPRLSTLERMGAAVGHAVEVRLVPEDEGARQRRRRELRSLAIAAAVAAAVERDVEGARRLARSNLARAASLTSSQASSRWSDEWSAALDGGSDAIRSILLDPSAHGHDMRQMTPLSGLISDAERRAALAAVDALLELEAVW
jgi:transcriptional regulator with XRE-family HTH domain